ncbi:hypothetical protein LTR36_008280 [Oleoguttula mirabilis]|uniref:Uncharacterized protein n=1 Tax=Oleoguttula mirabilis TaxID=1507867 RepID=A0AAV9J8Z6_9PEZI|nr:hypothetical protein LTR36_008280 [Oleoguttula mirabilis]
MDEFLIACRLSWEGSSTCGAIAQQQHSENRQIDHKATAVDPLDIDGTEDTEAEVGDIVKEEHHTGSRKAGHEPMFMAPLDSDATEGTEAEAEDTVKDECAGTPFIVKDEPTE